MDSALGGGFAVGPNNWRQSLEWSDSHGEKWGEGFGKKLFERYSGKDRARCLDAMHFVVDALEKKKNRDAQEEEIYQWCLTRVTENL